MLGYSKNLEKHGIKESSTKRKLSKAGLKAVVGVSKFLKEHYGSKTNKETVNHVA